MELDYSLIGKRVANRRKKQKLTQEKLSEEVGSSASYISNIERAVSIPSIETVMKLALALETTPDEFLVGTARHGEEKWKDVAESLKGLTPKQLELTEQFIRWVSDQKL